MLSVMLFHHPVDARENKSLTIIIVPDFSFNEAKLLWEEGEIHALWERAAMGAMNIKPDGPYSYLNNMVSISSGARASGVKDWNSYEQEEVVDQAATANELLQRFSGRQTQSGLIHPLLHRLVEKNQQSSYQATIGILGDALEKANINRMVLGHSDTSEKVRYGSLLAINSGGYVEGYLDDTVQEESSAAFGLEMNGEYLLKQSIDHRGLTVIEWGDLYRLYQQRMWMDPIHFKEERLKQLLRLEDFVDRLVLETDGQVWLFSPMMNKEAYDAKQQLAPFYIWDEGMAGALTSKTTNQPFIMSNLDVIPTILSMFSVEEPDNPLLGHVVNITHRGVVDKSLIFDHVDELTIIYRTRANVLSAYITSLVLLLLVAGGLMWFKKPKSLAHTFLKIIVLSALSSPLAFLVGTKLLIHIGVFGFVSFVIGFSLLCGYLFHCNRSQAIATLGAVTFFLISIDLLLGTPLMQRSYLGYDPIIGARYYGIGNEYAGIYIVSAFALLSGFSFAKKKHILLIVAIVGIIQLIMLGHSQLGTNAGATVSAGLAYFFLMYRLLSVKWSMTRFFVLGVGSIFTLFCLLYVLQLTGDQTHIGAAFHRLLQGDHTYIQNTVERKLAMNWKIFRHSNWTQLFVTSYIVGAVMLFRRTFLKGDGKETWLLQTGVVASVALLLLNDSGVVAAATSMFCIVSVYYYWLMEHKQKGEHEIGEEN